MTRKTEITFEEILAEIFQKLLKKKKTLILIYRKLSKFQVGWNQDILNQCQTFERRKQRDNLPSNKIWF